MTLRMQLVLTITALFLVLFAGVAVISVNNTRHYLDEQLSSLAQDTATSLGLSLSPHMKKNDLPMMRSMVSAIFDRGYYREIDMISIHGEPMIRMENPVKVHGVPSWFVDLVPLETPEGEALVMSGWRQAATIHVWSHPGYAYQQLWKTSVDEFRLFLLLASVTLLAGFIALHFILRSLRKVEEQANAISSREYLVQEKLPWTRDLRRVVEVMNRMSIKVGEMFREQESLTEMFRAETLKDAVTGIGNRRFFDARMDHLVASSEEFYRGALFLISLGGFARFNEERGFAAGDELLAEFAKGLGAIAELFPGSVHARFSGANFVLLVPGMEPEGSGEAAGRITALIESAFSGFEAEEYGHVGISFFEKGMTSGELLAEADLALHAAQAEEALGWRRFEGRLKRMEEVQGAIYWKNLLKSVLESGEILLHFQPVVSCIGSRVLHQEVLIRIARGEEIINAGLFLPMAEKMGVSVRLDRLVVEKTIGYLERYENSRFAINLSIASVLDRHFCDWLFARLQGLDGKAARLRFELDEHDIVRHLEAVEAFVLGMKKTGCGFGADHCGRGFASFGYLATLKLDYLNIDGSYVRKLDNDLNSRFLVQAMTRIAHEVDVEVYAESVETESEREMLSGLYVNGCKGYLIGRPSADISE